MGQPRTRWNNYIDELGWNRLELYPSEYVECGSAQQCVAAQF